jgi:hypothetical protein
MKPLMKQQSEFDHRVFLVFYQLGLEVIASILLSFWSQELSFD